MNGGLPRVALFTDSFYEVNGVALTYRQLDAFARRRQLPFFNLHAGPETKRTVDGPVVSFELKRSWVAVPLEKDLYSDLFFMRYKGLVRDALAEFQPDLIHITGPNDIGLLGAMLAKELDVPLTAAWHTNAHEFAAWRLENMLAFLPDEWKKGAGDIVEEQLLGLFTRLYGAARMCFAPNPELIEMLKQRTGRPTHVMVRGVDVDQFTPAKRRRSDSAFEIGYVGRISAEKNVRFFRKLEEGLLAAGKRDFRITFVGHGSERHWLERHMTRTRFTGVLHGDDLARAFADFDVFAFPSFTDTYGNVINEAMASGVPCVVTLGGGPKYLVRDGETGFVAQSENDFVTAVLAIMNDPGLLERMRAQARTYAIENSWDRVFERLYDRYVEMLAPTPVVEGLQTA